MRHDRQHGCAATLRAMATIVVFASLSNGCAFVMQDKIHYVADPAERSAASCDPNESAVAGDRILGIALSGGGSRAAVFGAAALEAMSEHGILGQASHLSSVSGGSLAASYFLTHPSACDEQQTQTTAGACWRDYFVDFKEQMRFDYRSRVIARNAQPTRFSSPTRRVISLQEELDKRFLGGATFGELGSSPVLLINATSYDERRRFVFSNACLAAGAAGSSVASQDLDGKRFRVMAQQALAQPALQAFTFSYSECPRMIPGDLPVSLAVAASAAFPPAIGPVSIEAPSECDGGTTEWWHLGDGGAIENSGTDSLDEVLLRRLAADGPPLKTALILSVDAGKRLDPEDLKLEKNFEMYSTPARVNLVVESPRVRGQAYHDIFWDELVDELRKEGIGYEKITFRFSEAQLDEVPNSCSGELFGTELIREHLLGIATDFTIDECSADLLEIAAHQLVHATLDDAAVSRLTSSGFPIHTGRDCAAIR